MVCSSPIIAWALKYKTLLISNLPLLVVGGKDEGYIDDVVQDFFSRSLSVEANLKYWGNFWAVLLTRSALQSDQVLHEVVVEVNGTIDVDTYPKANLLYNLEMENKMCTLCWPQWDMKVISSKCTHQE